MSETWAVSDDEARNLQEPHQGLRQQRKVVPIGVCPACKSKVIGSSEGRCENDGSKLSHYWGWQDA